tara:strand:- start:435 stop:683 length:249 start_codon:yes stop_codon:yes gene_type:complete
MKYNIIKNTNELDVNFKIRKKFIEYLNPKNKKELILFNNYSNILINIIYLGNKFDSSTTNIIKEILKSSKSMNFKNILKYID